LLRRILVGGAAVVGVPRAGKNSARDERSLRVLPL